MHFVNIVSSHLQGSVFDDALIHLFKCLIWCFSHQIVELRTAVFVCMCVCMCAFVVGVKLVFFHLNQTKVGPGCFLSGIYLS